MTTRSHRRGRGALMMLAGFLALSGALRLGIGLTDAYARAPEAAAEVAVTTTCTPSLALVEAMQEREEGVRLREAMLADRLSALSLAEQAIEARLAELRAAEAELSETLSRADGAAERDLARLTAVYESMKHKDAAILFEAMAPEFAAGFLGRMRPDAAAAVLSGMSAEAGYAVSVLLAGRNARVPRE